MQTLLRRFSVAIFCLGLAACSGHSQSSAVPPTSLDESRLAATPVNGEAAAGVGALSVDRTAAALATAAAGPYRVHAFLEDTTGNMGCLYSGNYAAVRNEADITEAGLSGNGRHPCPASFDKARHAAGLKIYSYNDVAMVGNGMPVSAISQEYYYKDSKCSAPFVMGGTKATNGREITNIAQFPTQVATQVNAWEDKHDADYFFNDDFGDIGVEGIPVDSLCKKQWSVASYTAAFPAFLDRLNVPQIVNLASNYGDPYTAGVLRSNVFMISAEEGIVNFKRGAMFNTSYTELKLARLLEFQESGKKIALIQYNPNAKDKNGNPVEFPAGFDTMYDQRMWNYAGGWLVLDLAHFYMETANEGDFTNSGATIEPEYYLVPQNPLKTVSSGALSRLQVGNVLVREYKTCYYKSKYIGTCAMVLNANANTSTIPRLAQTYNHSVVISGEGAMPALSAANGGVSTRADTGTLSYNGPRVTKLAAGRAVILIQ